MKIYLIIPPSNYGTIRAFTTMKAAEEAFIEIAKEVNAGHNWKQQIDKWKNGDLRCMNRKGGFYIIKEVEVEE